MRLCLALIFLTSPLTANPVMDGADPHATVAGRVYWMYPTEARSRQPIFAAYRSTDLRTWKREGTILDLDKIPWVKADGAPYHGAWAPALAEKKGKFYFYFSVGPQNPTPSRIGVAAIEALIENIHLRLRCGDGRRHRLARSSIGKGL